MASQDTFASIKTALDASWTTTPIYYENERYELPDTPSPFVFVEVFGDSYNQETMGAPGANQWLEAGVLYLHVMVPFGSGTTTGRQYADSLLNIFREVQVGDLVITEMSIGKGDPGQEFPNYWAVTATVYWSRRDITGV